MVCDVGHRRKIYDSNRLAYVHAKFALRPTAACLYLFVRLVCVCGREVVFVCVGVQVNLKRRANTDAMQATVRWPLARC